MMMKFGLLPRAGVRVQRERSSSSSRALLSVLLVSLGAATCAVEAQNVQFLPNVNVVAGAAAGSTFTTYTGEGGPATAATFGASIVAATMDAYGNIFLIDTTGTGTATAPAPAIRRVDAVTGNITTYAGGLVAGSAVCAQKTDAIGNGCPATQATLSAPAGLRFYKGDLYIADTNNNEVRVVNGTTGVISIFAGTGTKALVVAGSSAVTTPFSAPEDIAFDAVGNAFVPTAGGFPYVLRIDAVTQKVAIVAGTGLAGSTGDGGPGLAATVQTPVGIAVDLQGNVYFSSTTPETVRRITIPAGLTTGIISTYAGTNGSKGFGGDGGPATAPIAQLQSPGRIAFDAFGNLFIADQLNHRIREVTAAGVLSTVLGTGTPSDSPSGTVATNANLNNPRSVDFTPAGDLLIADGFNRRIKVVTPPANFAATAVGATVTATASARVNTALTLGTYQVPAGYKDFSSGTVTNCTAGAAVAAGTICAVPLTFSPVVAGLQGAPLQFVDSARNVYSLAVEGLGNAPAATVLPGIVNPVAGTGTAGNSGNGTPATAAQLNNPTALAFDSVGNTFFADTANNEVREVSAAGTITTIAGTGAAGFGGDGGAATAALLNAPAGLAVDGAGNLYIADTGNNRIRLVSNGTITTFAGTGVPCNFAASSCGNGGPAALALMSAPQGLFLTPSGVLYVAESGSHVIRTIGVRSMAINTLAGTGVAGFAGDTGESAGAQFNAPGAVVVDNTGNIYVADSGNNAIRVIRNGTINTFAGSSTAGFSDGGATTALFRAPAGLAVDAAGSVYVADTGNHAIRRIAAGQVLTVAGTGTAGAGGNGGNSNLAAFSSPRGVGLDNGGNVVVADSGNNALRAVAAAAAKIVYPTTSPNTTSAPVNETLSNSGNLPLAVASIVLPAGFAEQASGQTDCSGAPLTLAPGAGCQASLVFKPTMAQTYTGNAVITDNAQNAAAATQTIALQGVAAFVYTAAIAAPSQVTAGQAFSITVSVTNPNSVYLGTVRFTSSDPNSKSVLPAPYTFTAADNGTHVFTGLQLLTAGTEMVTVTDVVNASVTATAVITVVGGPPASLVIVSGNLQTANIDSTTPSMRNFQQPLTVEVLDSLGNPSAGASVTFTAPTTGADASFAGSSATFTGVSNARGLVLTPLLTADQVTGSFAVTSVTAGAPAVSFTLTNVSSVQPGFSLSSNPPSLDSLPPGTSTTALITITPAGGFNAPVNVSCATSAPQTTCTLSTATVAPSGNGTPTSFTLKLASTGPATTATLGLGQTPMYAGFLLLSLGAAFRKRRRLRSLLVAILFAMVLAAVSGCGSNLHANQTYPGSYTLTVTGVAGGVTSVDTIPFYVAGAP